MMTLCICRYSPPTDVDLEAVYWDNIGKSPIPFYGADVEYSLLSRKGDVLDFSSIHGGLLKKCKCINANINQI